VLEYYKLPARRVKVKMPSQESTFRKDIKKTIFPRIYNNDHLVTDKNLKSIKLISPKTKTALNKAKVQIPFELLRSSTAADVFLYLNGQKTDMYYSIPSGKYTFNLYLKTGKSIVEIFYIINGCKSTSVFNTIIRK
jgi:hypothetical protein